MENISPLTVLVGVVLMGVLLFTVLAIFFPALVKALGYTGLWVCGLSQDYDQDGTRDTYERQLGMGNGCACEPHRESVFSGVNSLLPNLGKKKCVTPEQDCEKLLQDRCIVGDKGLTIGAIDGRPHSKECEDKFGELCHILTIDGDVDKTIPNYEKFRGVCNKAEQCVMPCEFCPFFALDKSDYVCPRDSVGGTFTPLYRCLPNSKELETKGVLCRPESNLCPTGQGCCDQSQMVDIQRQEESEQALGAYEDCRLAKNEPDQNERHKKQQDPIYQFRCLQLAAMSCIKATGDTPGRCFELWFGLNDVLSRNKYYKISFRQQTTTTIRVSLKDENQPFVEETAHFDLDPGHLCWVSEGASWIFGDIKTRNLCKDPNLDYVLALKSEGMLFSGGPVLKVVVDWGSDLLIGDIFSFPVPGNNRLCFKFVEGLLKTSLPCRSAWEVFEFKALNPAHGTGGT